MLFYMIWINLWLVMIDISPAILPPSANFPFRLRLQNVLAIRIRPTHVREGKESDRDEGAKLELSPQGCQSLSVEAGHKMSNKERSMMP